MQNSSDFFSSSGNSWMTMRTQNINDLYYDAMEAIQMGDFKSAEKMLKEAVKMDSDYVQNYVGLAHLYGNTGETEKAEENIRIAFEKVQKKFPKWPKDLGWGDLDNRAYLRAIQYRADLCVDEKDEEKAKELYRLLLKLNPNDNQGVRYVLAGLYAGIDGKGIDKMFEEGNAKQNWSKLEKLVATQNKIHKFWIEPNEN